MSTRSRWRKLGFAVLTSITPLVLQLVWVTQTRGYENPAVNFPTFQISLPDAIKLSEGLAAASVAFWSLSFLFDWITGSERVFKSVVALLLFLIALALWIQLLFIVGLFNALG
jgi:hypothetical protein